MIVDVKEYRFGFNGKESDNEIYGDKNAYDFGARMYDSRIGRWFSVDKIVKPHLSSYQFGAGNPIIFIDPDGNTEFYFNGNWIGTDGQKNNLISVVKSPEVKDEILSYTLQGLNYTGAGDLQHGTNSSDMLVINLDVLNEANNVLELDISDSKVRERGSIMEANLNGGFDVCETFIGKEVNLETDNVAIMEDIPQGGDVVIHSHVTEFFLDQVNGRISSADADSPGPLDPSAFSSRYMNIIVGKSGLAVRNKKDINAPYDAPLYSSPERTNVINVFTGGSATDPVKIKQSDAVKMIKGERGRNGKKFDKAKTKQPE